MKVKIKNIIDSKNKSLEAKRARLKELEASSERSEDLDELKGINAEMRGLNEDIDGIIAELDELKTVYGEMDEPAGEGENGGAGEGARSARVKAITGQRGGEPEGKGASDEEAEKRAQAFANSGRMSISNKEARAVLVSSGKIATPTEVGGITEKFNTVSSIVDMVKVTNADKMGAYNVAYEDADAAAAATAEGAAYNESDPTFGFVEIKPEKQTVISYISDEVRNQSPLDYEAKVKESALTALRKRAADYISEKLIASDLCEFLPVSAIGPDTLRKIALNYGGDENVVGGAVLNLNKKDLIAFGDVRGTNEKKAVYEITPDENNANTGTIKDGGLSVKYCINSKCAALSEAEAEAKTMFYGVTSDAFELALFSDYTVKVSEDFKFDKGLLTVRGDVSIGGEVIKKKGFVVVKKGA